jgi:3-isopropylmalate/(R)-2-methylmalate dehydratase small subunit
VPLRRSDVDTDQIIPAVYLEAGDADGFEDGLFAAWRADPDFVLNRPQHAGASILVRRRELRHRLVAGTCRVGLAELRFPAVLSSRFADIFRGQLAQGRPADRRRSSRASSSSCGSWSRPIPTTEVTVDLVARRSALGSLTAPFDIDDYGRWRLLEGLDDIGLTLRHADALTDFESSRPSWLPTTTPA